MQYENLKAFLDAKVKQYNRPEFIENDPVVIPHQFSVKQDIEIMGFWSAMLAWGQRKTIINKCNELIRLMDGAPYDFIKNHQETDLKRFSKFKHRTFNDTDTLYFIEFFRQHYQISDTLETAFTGKTGSLQSSVSSPGFALSNNKMSGLSTENCQLNTEIETCLNNFRTNFFSLPDFPQRTVKHVSSPKQKSACKRLNMFLRWMVRSDEKGVDFGIWKNIKPAQLICPADVHVERVARKLNLITRKQADWQMALELTENLRQFDSDDPVKYDFALFGLGIEGKF